MKIWKADLFCKTNLTLGEGAFWHSGWQQFLYVDIEAKKIGRIAHHNPVQEEIDVKEMIGTVVPYKENKLIVALQNSIEIIDFLTGENEVLIIIESHKPGNRCNDGKCDYAGRLWIGTMDINATSNQGALYLFDGDALKLKLEGRSISNGICWSLDHKTMFYIDSLEYDIKAYDFDLETGNISKERIVVELKEPGQVMDGMTIDSEGMLWVAIWGGGCVNRFDPATGALIGKVLVDAPNVSSCCFGGENLQHLFITTAASGLSSELLEKYPNSGSLFMVDTGVTGAEMNHYGEKK